MEEEVKEEKEKEEPITHPVATIPCGYQASSCSPCPGQSSDLELRAPAHAISSSPLAKFAVARTAWHQSTHEHGAWFRQVLLQTVFPIPSKKMRIECSTG